MAVYGHCKTLSKKVYAYNYTQVVRVQTFVLLLQWICCTNNRRNGWNAHSGGASVHWALTLKD